jgi:hypothetical protein
MRTPRPEATPQELGAHDFDDPFNAGRREGRERMRKKRRNV